MGANYSGLINKKNLAKAIETLPVKHNAIFDLVYKGGVIPHSSPDFDFEEKTISEDEVVPTIVAGSPAIALGYSAGIIKSLTPDPIEVSFSLKPKDVIHMKNYNDDSKQAIVNRYVKYCVNRIYNTKVSMATKSLNGNITWMRRSHGGMNVELSATFFDILTSPTGFVGSWSASTKPSVVIKDLDLMVQAQEDLGKGQTPVFYAGRTTFAILSDIAGVQINNRATQYNVGNREIDFNGYIIRNEQFRYHALSKSNVITTASLIGAKELLMLDQNGDNFERYALPIYDFDADLAALPLYIKDVVNKELSSLGIQAKSTPLYLPTKNSITKVTAAA